MIIITDKPIFLMDGLYTATKISKEILSSILKNKTHQIKFFLFHDSSIEELKKLKIKPPPKLSIPPAFLRFKLEDNDIIIFIINEGNEISFSMVVFSKIVTAID